jgi:hypothetical protein
MPQVRSPIRNVVNAIAKRWQRWKDLRELDNCREELGVIASDLGTSTNELYRLSEKGPDAARELHNRLAALHLVEEASAQPFVMRDLERVCSLCGSKQRCNRDLARGFASLHDAYCPNQPTMVALAHLPLASERDQEKRFS